jgi:tetratricopeptide (TPR) repeat protein
MNKGKQFLFIAVILFATWFAYSGHFNNAFHFDDHHTIVDNQSIRSLNVPLFFKDAATLSTLPLNQAYRPGVTTLNALDIYLSGKDKPEPFMFHVSIFISFLICGILFYLLLLSLLKSSFNNTAIYWVSLFITAAFLLHTANAETINYIISRSDSFSTLVVILSFVLYLYCPGARIWHLYFIPSFLGFFVKEQTLMFIPVLMVYKLLFEQDADLNIWKHKSGVFKILKSVAIPLIASVAIFMFSRSMTPKNWSSGGGDPLKYLFTQPSVIFHYIYNFLLPVNLVIDTDWTIINSYFEDRVFAGLIFIGLLVYSTIKISANKNYKLFAFGVSWFIITLLPTSSIISFSEVLNDHRPFLPYIGLFIAIAALVAQFLSSEFYQRRVYLRYALPVLAFMFLSLHGYGTYHRCEVWKTEESLWKDATIKAPQNGRAWLNYGLTQMAVGKYQAAETCFNRTVQLLPNYTYVYINLGIVKNVTGRPVEAEADFKKAITLGVNVPETYYHYADFLNNAGRVSDARSMVSKGLALSPAHAPLKALEAKINNLSPTVIKPVTAEDFVNQSLAYYNEGKFDSCIVASQNAIKLRPGYDLAYNNICAAYNQLKSWDKAIEAGLEGLKFNPANVRLKGNLNVAYVGKAEQKK